MARRKNATVDEVAEYLMNMYCKGNNRLDQRDAVTSVSLEFGDEFAKQSSATNATLSAAVRAAFKRLSGPDVVFDNNYKCWRPRGADEDQKRERPNRLQRTASSN